MPSTEGQLLRTPPSKRSDASTQRAQHTPAKAETPEKEHQRFVLTDPIASRYLADDPATVLLERGSKLSGYECYIVEQWAVSRTDPTFMITTYTGDSKHAVTADVLGVPSDEKIWSLRLRVFFKALNQHHARREKTSLGTLIVTNLSGFPSSLTVIPVPDGNLMNNHLHFVVNENLKRLGCLGRLGLTLGPAPSSASAKFYQIYHTSEKNDIQESVVQLVRLCQLALFMFDKLDIEFTDGLLCDATEKAIGKWWNEVGAEHYGTEPHDGPLGPTTVAALLGLLMGARSRLRSFGMPVPKDALDLEGMKRAISIFQKQQRLPKTKRLDRATLSLLMKATAKAAAADGWAVTKAVKSTVAELSGRGGEMLNDVVRKRDRAGIAEIETTDYERFVELAYGAHAKWLWHGKALKNASGAAMHKHRGKESQPTDQASPRSLGVDTDGSDAEAHRSGLVKRATDLTKEANRGLGKIKDVVHLRQRHGTAPRQAEQSPQSVPRTSVDEPIKSDYSSQASPFNGPTSPISPAFERVPEFSLTATASRVSRADRTSGDDSRDHSPGYKHAPKLTVSSSDDVPTVSSKHKQDILGAVNLNAKHVNKVHGMQIAEHDLDLPDGVDTSNDIGLVLRRTISDGDGLAARSPLDRPSLYPKHLSFTLAEDTILPCPSLEAESSDDSSLGDDAVYAARAYKAERQRQLRLAIKELQVDAAVWTEQQLSNLRKLVDQTGVDHEAAEKAYRPRVEEMQSLRSNIEILLRDERERLEDGTKELETLSARLNYEIDGLKGRIEDVDQVVDDFESAVQRVEDRVEELEKDDFRKRGIDCTLM